MPKETTLTNSIIRYLRSQGCRAWKVHMSMYGDTGQPDVEALCLVSYQEFAVPLYIEVKQPGKKPTPLQMKRIRDLNKVGACAFWTDNLQDVKNVIIMIRRSTR